MSDRRTTRGSLFTREHGQHGLSAPRFRVCGTGHRGSGAPPVCLDSPAETGIPPGLTASAGIGPTGGVVR